MSEYAAYISKIISQKSDILKSLEFVGWKDHVKESSTVFIKPNFTFPYHKEGVTSRPEFLKDLLELIKDRADRVIIGESDGGNRSFTADAAFKGHNIYEICKDTGVELVNLSQVPSMAIEEVIQGKKVKVLLPKLLLNEVDCFVSTPVLKVHVMTGVTLSIKNLWGCYPDTMRGLHHKYLDRKLALITKCLCPQLAVIDGSYALDGHGPMFGAAKKVDLIISSNNSVVADSLGSAVMGIPLSKARHILVAERERLGVTRLDRIKLNDDSNKFKMDFHIEKTLIDKLSFILFNSEIAAKLAMDSPLSQMAYGLARHLRNSDEVDIANDLRRYHK